MLSLEQSVAKDVRPMFKRYNVYTKGEREVERRETGAYYRQYYVFNR